MSEKLVASREPIAATSSKHPKLDSLSYSEEQPALELPTLAPELWLNIATFVGPGTKSCANLVATCYEFYHLLMPVLMSEVTVHKKLKGLLDALSPFSAAKSSANSAKNGNESRLLSLEDKLPLSAPSAFIPESVPGSPVSSTSNTSK